MAEDQKTETKATPAEEAKTLGVKTSKVSIKRLKKGVNEQDEAKRNAELVKKRTANRVKKAKAEANSTPIKRRLAMIKAKMRAALVDPQKYPKKSLKNLIEEKRIIESSPKVWIKKTSKGTVPYPITPAQKKTVMQELSEQDLD